MMHTTSIFISLLATILALGAPTNVPISKFAGPVKADSYIIKLRDNISKDSHINALIAVATSGKIEHRYGSVFQGYAASLRGKDLDYVRQSKDVEYIIEDGIVTIDDEQGGESTTFSKFSKLPEPVEGLAGADGAGVDVYIFGTGIYAAHSCFGRRSRWGATFGGYTNQDGNGLSTHNAGTAVGTTYGQAPRANAIAVKVLSDSGAGTSSDVIAGINWAYNQYRLSNHSAVAHFAFGGSANTALDSVVSTAIAGGLPFIIAAGNSNVDAGSTSPGRVPGAIIVGSVDSSNRKAPFSGYGLVVDVWAPGVNILSAWIGGPNSTNTISSTSSAAAYVAGLVAVHLSNNPNKSPAQLAVALKIGACPIVAGVPSGTTNLLAQPF